MKHLVLILLLSIPVKSFALRKCTIWQVAVDETYDGGGTKPFIGNYFKHFDTATRGEFINKDPEKKKIKATSTFQTCKMIANRIAKNKNGEGLCNIPFYSNQAYVGAYGPDSGGVLNVPMKNVKTSRIHFKVQKNQGNFTIPVEDYIDCAT